MDVSTLNSTFATGGENELSEAIRLYGQLLLRFCHNILCDYFEAQDAVQDNIYQSLQQKRKFYKRHIIIIMAVPHCIYHLY